MTKSTGVGRGGKRAGAGAKSLDNAVLVGNVSASLDQESIDMLAEFPNVSVGLRSLLAELRTYRAGPRVLKSVSKLPPKPVRQIVSSLQPDGVSHYNLHTVSRKQAEADRKYEADLAKWNLENSGTASS